jgi:hypothetical protein
MRTDFLLSVNLEGRTNLESARCSESFNKIDIKEIKCENVNLIQVAEGRL